MDAGGATASPRNAAVSQGPSSTSTSRPITPTTRCSASATRWRRVRPASHEASSTHFCRVLPTMRMAVRPTRYSLSAEVSSAAACVPTTPCAIGTGAVV